MFKKLRSDKTGQRLGALEALAGLVGQVRQTADSIATGSNKIATGNADPSPRTEEQAANRQQTAATPEQLDTTVQNNAQTAQHAPGAAPMPPRRSRR